MQGLPNLTYLLVLLQKHAELNSLININFYVLACSFVLATGVYVCLNQGEVYYKPTYQNAFKSFVLALFGINFLSLMYYSYKFTAYNYATIAPCVNTAFTIQNAQHVNIVGLLVVYLCFFVGLVCLAVLGDRF